MVKKPRVSKPRVKKAKQEVVTIAIPKPDPQVLTALANSLVNDHALGLLPLASAVLQKANDHLFDLMSACQKVKIVSSESMMYAKHVELLTRALEHTK